MALGLRLLSVCPRLQIRDGDLVVSTPRRVQLLTLGCFRREVILDGAHREIRITRRLFWLGRKTRRLRFDWVEGVAYGYKDLTPFPALQMTHDGCELFTIALRLYGADDEVHLFHYFGGGTFTNNGPFPDWLYWDEYMFDVTGTQDSESRALVDLLSRVIGAPVVPLRR